MELKCVRGHIGLDGVRYSIDDIISTDVTAVSDALIGGGFAIDVSKTPKPKPKPIDEPVIVPIPTARKTTAKKTR